MNTAGPGPHDSSQPTLFQDMDRHESDAMEDEMEDADTASQPSMDIPLDSPPESPRITSSLSVRSELSQKSQYILGSEDPLISHTHTQRQTSIESSTYPLSVTNPILYDEAEAQNFDVVSGPTVSSQTELPESPSVNSRASMAPSLASTLVSEPESMTSTTSSSSYAKKIRPESLILDPRVAKLIIGLAVVDFNHIVCRSCPFFLMYILRLINLCVC